MVSASTLASSPDAALLLQLLQQSREGSVLCDAQGYVRWCNRAAATWLLLPPELASRGQHCDAIFSRLQAELTWTELCAAYALHTAETSQPASPLQLRLLAVPEADESRPAIPAKPVLEAYFSALSSNDPRYAYLLSLQDVSLRQEAEVALRANEAKYRLAQHATGVGVWDWNVAEDTIHWDASCWRMLGYEAQDEASADSTPPIPALRFADWRAMLHPDDAAYTEAQVWAQLASGDSFVQEFRYRRADGGWHWVQGRGQVVAKDSQGQPLRMLGTHTDIDQRKQAELALADSEARFRQLFELYPDALMLLDPHSAKPLYYNRAAYHQLGYEAAEFADMNPRDWDALESPQETQARLERLRRGSLEDFQTLHRHRDGRHIPVRVRATLLELASSSYLLVIMRDISAIKASEQRAENLAQRLRKLAQQLPGMVYQYQQWPDSRACFPYCSEGIQHIYGCNPEEVRDDASLVFTRLHPEDAVRVRDSVQSSAQSLQLWLEQYRVQHPDGHTLWVEGQATPEAQDDGSVLWHGYIADISDRKRAEVALQESELRFRQFADTIDVVFWIRTGDSMLYINPAYESLWGRSREALYSQPNAFIEAVHPEDRKRVAAAMQHAHEHGGHFDQSYRILHPEQGVRWVHARSHAVPSTSANSSAIPEKSTERFVGIATDITERLAAEATLQQQREALARSNAELEHFAYAVSHDLRQPLRMVSSYITLLQRRLPLQEDSDNLQMMGFVREGAKRMEQMLLSLLEYSRVGRKGEPKATIDSREALEEALHFLSPRIAETGAHIHYEPPWPQLWASPDEFTRLLQNLINNALTYHPAKQAPVIRLHVRPEEHQQRSYWLFSVADEGIGIDSSQIPRLFQIFQRLHSRQDYEGTGVGLAVCRKIVEHHDGDIWVESAGLGKGSCFYFRLPRYDSEHHDTHTALLGALANAQDPQSPE